MHNLKVVLAILTVATAAVRGQSIDDDDVPPQCRDICRPVIQLEQQCDDQYDDDNNGGRNGNNGNNDDDNNNNNPPGPAGNNNANTNQQYRDCVCQGQNAAQALQTCQQCTAQYPDYYRDNDDNRMDENEVETWLQLCGVQAGGGPMTPMSPGATPTQTGPQSLTTSVLTYPCTDNDRDGNDDDNDNDDLDTCTSTVVGPVGGVLPPGITPSPTSGFPTTMVTGSMSTVTQTFACTDNDNDGNDDDNDNDDLDTCTRTTVIPVGATIGTGTLRPTGTQTGVTQYTGAAAMATVMPYVGAGAIFMLAGFAM